VSRAFGALVPGANFVLNIADAVKDCSEMMRVTGLLPDPEGVEGELVPEEEGDGSGRDRGAEQAGNRSSVKVTSNRGVDGISDDVFRWVVFGTVFQISYQFAV